MSKRIQTYDDLLEEKKRLQELLPVHKEQLHYSWGEMKESFKPVSNVFAFFGKMAKRDKTNPLLNIGIDVAGDVLLRKILLAKAGWLTRFAVPFLVKNYSSNVLSGKATNLLGRLRELFRKDKKLNGQHAYNYKYKDSKPPM